jgi:hypothetical protein
VVPLAVDDPRPRSLQAEKAPENGLVVRKVAVRVADQEFEEVTEDDEKVRTSFLFGEKREECPVITICRLAEVGIC